LEDYAKRGVAYRYLDVRKDPEAMTQMLEHSEGRREVPVMVDSGRVTIGFGGT
jgi:glutaredoxin